MLELINVEGLYCHCMSFIDNDLSLMSEEERKKLYDGYKWMFSSGCETPTLEPLIKGNDPRVNTFRSKFKEWFMVVCAYSLSPYTLGQTSYSHYLNNPRWQGTKVKGNKGQREQSISSTGNSGSRNDGYLYQIEDQLSSLE